MRTTVTLDSDTEVLIRKLMRARGLSFKKALNEAVRDGLTSSSAGATRYRTTTANLGLPAVNLDRALQLAAQLEDEEIIRKIPCPFHLR